MKRVFIALAIFLNSTFFDPVLFAQEIDWETAPSLHQIPDSFKEAAAVFILDSRNIQVVSEKEELYTYRTLHRIIKVETDKGIEYFNTMTIGLNPENELVAVHARTITSAGEIINITPDKIKKGPAEDGGVQYHVAFEGVDKGSEVELIYTEKRPFSAFGLEVMQFGLPVVKAVLNIDVPETVEFKIKGYNGFPAAEDIVIADRRYYTAEQIDIPALEEEEYSDYSSNVMRIEYKLEKVGANTRLYSWDQLAQRLYEGYCVFTDKELKEVNAFLRPLNLQQEKDIANKIMKIEAFIKTSIVIKENLDEEQYSKLSYIIEKKTATEKAIIRLYAAAWNIAGIEYQLGLSSNRFDHPVDPGFENWNMLDVYLFWFPDTKEYLSPGYETFRYPMIPVMVRDNEGIFCAESGRNGSPQDARAAIRKIPQLPYDQSHNDVITEISFNASMEPEIKATHTFSGYSAPSVREAFVYIEKDKEIELVQSLINIAEKKEDIVSYTVNNKGLQHYSDNKPLEVISVVKAPQLVESAGNKLLLKIGDVIGPQAQLYRQERRRLPVSMPFTHTLDRTLIVNIPEGYKVANPDDATIAVADPGKTMGFTSSCQPEGNRLTIHIHEFYSQTTYPATLIEEFRKVINAAADFNKVVLVLEKK